MMKSFQESNGTVLSTNWNEGNWALKSVQFYQFSNKCFVTKSNYKNFTLAPIKVGKEKVEMKPPDSMEFKKWEG